MLKKKTPKTTMHNSPSSPRNPHKQKKKKQQKSTAKKLIESFACLQFICHHQQKRVNEA